MLAHDEVERAVDIQARGYHLIQWLESALERGFLRLEAAEDFTDSRTAAREWILRHRLAMPERARPPQGSELELANYFSTYVDCSFDFEAVPGERLYPFEQHCWCPFCSYMVRKPHLRPKKLSRRDRWDARRWESDWLKQLALETGRELREADLENLLDDETLREDLALCTYTFDLLRRLKGVGRGPGTLALWRIFAWTREGSPKRDFRLSTQAILEAQGRVLSRL